jgi:RNA recognition motif-containing protein
MRLYVGNLSFKTSEDEIKAMFEEYGQVDSVTVLRDKFTGESRGFGFVDMPDKTQADAAIAAVNGRDVGGRALKVNEAREQEPRSGGGGGGGGRREGGGYSDRR